MEVTVRLFAMLRERAGRARRWCSSCPRAPAWPTRWPSCTACAEGLPLVMAVNREYADADAGARRRRRAGADPAGERRRARVRAWVRVTAEPLSLDALAARVRDPRAGAVVTFQGVTREVERLEYEAYAEMAEERLAAIARRGGRAPRALRRGGGAPGGRRAAVGAERGVAASAPHRGEAFAGAREIIDRVKAEAPIWKKEIEGGEGRWVEGRPPA